MTFTEIDPTFRLPDEVWERLKSVILSARPKPKGGRPRKVDRAALDAILVFLHNPSKRYIPEWVMF